MTERYLTINAFLKQKFDAKFVKLAIDGGFTCPNRDGTLSFGGCLFCSELGSGEFTGLNHESRCRQATRDVVSQIDVQKRLMQNKWDSEHYIAYFQNFTNTYEDVSVLKSIYDSALMDPNIEGLAISTRADCVNDEVIELLKTYRSLDVFWVEMGLQTTLEESRRYLNLHQSLSQFSKVAKKLKEAEIPLVIHVIAGIPNETKADFLKTIEYVNQLAPFGIKIHMLNILKGTALGRIYEERPFDLLTREVYIEWVCEALTYLSPEITVHRLTGDGAKNLIIEPKWVMDKRSVLNGISKYLSKHDFKQGSKINNVV